MDPGLRIRSIFWQDPDPVNKNEKKLILTISKPVKQLHITQVSSDRYLPTVGTVPVPRYFYVDSFYLKKLENLPEIFVCQFLTCLFIFGKLE